MALSEEVAITTTARVQYLADRFHRVPSDFSFKLPAVDLAR